MRNRSNKQYHNSFSSGHLCKYKLFIYLFYFSEILPECDNGVRRWPANHERRLSTIGELGHLVHAIGKPHVRQSDVILQVIRRRRP